MSARLADREADLEVAIIGGGMVGRTLAAILAAPHGEAILLGGKYISANSATSGLYATGSSTTCIAWLLLGWYRLRRQAPRQVKSERALLILGKFLTEEIHNVGARRWGDVTIVVKKIRTK